MRPLKPILTLCGFLATNLANAIDPEYYAPLKGYAAQMDREPTEVKNPGISVVAARSKARRAELEAMSNVHGSTANTPDRESANADDNGGDINIASPHIEGGNRGNVTVIVERGAIKGNITTVRK